MSLVQQKPENLPAQMFPLMVSSSSTKAALLACI